MPFLSRDDFDRYLALAFAGHQFPEELASVLHARTEGNPLFMVDLLRYLRDRGVIVQDHGHWALVRAIPDLQRELPESVRSMIQRKVDQLGAADRNLLMVASVMGPEFGSVGVSQVLDRETADVEERLAVLESVHGMVRLVGERMLPDGVVTVRYGFVHVLIRMSCMPRFSQRESGVDAAAAGPSLIIMEKRAATGLLTWRCSRWRRELPLCHYLVAAENLPASSPIRRRCAAAGLAFLHTLPDTPNAHRPFQMTLGMQQVTQVTRAGSGGDLPAPAL